MRLARLGGSILLVGLTVFGAGVAPGQNYPEKTIRLLTSPPGGGGDSLSRLVAQGLSGPLGQPVIVDNRPPGLLGELLAKAPADGYTMLLLASTLWYTPLLQKTPYDPVKDFAPITIVGVTPSLLIVHPSLPIKSVKEFIALAKARPGELNYASSGTASSAQLAAELFKSMAGVDIVGIPYKGAGPALNSVLGGETQIMFATAGTATPQIKSGRLKTLAVCSIRPSALAPGLPTVAASGLPGFEAGNTYAMFLPAKTSDGIIARLNQEIVRMLNRPEVKEQLLKSGVEAVGSSPAELAAAIKSDMAQLGKVIREAGIKIE